jgi:hypothetical protein
MKPASLLLQADYDSFWDAGEYIGLAFKEKNPSDFSVMSMLSSVELTWLILVWICWAVLAIVFLQSGLDKVFNYKSNFEWLKGHFAASPFKRIVPLLMAKLTIFECFGGLGCAVGVLFGWTIWGQILGISGLFMCILALLGLLLGQRIAKDYAGATGLMGYFIVAMFGVVGSGLSGMLAMVIMFFEI